MTFMYRSKTFTAKLILFNKIKTKDIQTWADKNIRSTKFIENIILQKIFVQ